MKRINQKIIGLTLAAILITWAAIKAYRYDQWGELPAL